MANLSRRDFLAGSALAPAAAQSTASRKLNYIFYMPETLRAESLGC
ncbi:MAG: twin-arginine translocation signal domain-containing protein, partial [Bryobacteraceae bacterium]